MEFQKPIFQKLATLDHLPTLPQILLKLIHTCGEDSANAGDISEIVEKDPALSSRILRLVNSAYYSLPYNVSSIRQAVSLVGTGTVKNLAFCASVCEAFRKTKKASGFNIKRYWWHSLRCGLLSRLLAKEINYSQPEEAFLCGLFHDIGILVLWVHFGDTYGRILAEHLHNEEALLAAEVRLGATHSEVGAWLLRRWDMPSFMSDAVLYHHETGTRIQSALPLVKIVYSAHSLTSEGMYLDSGTRTGELVLGLPADHLKALLKEADERIEEVAKALNIEAEAPSEEDSPEEEPAKGKDELIREVRDISLMQSTLESLLRARNRREILDILRQGLQILFDTANVLIFLSDPAQESFSCTFQSKESNLFSPTDISVPYTMKDSLLNASMTESKALNSFSEPSDYPQERPILDDQIIRFLGKEGILCLPMRASDEPVGVIVIGLDQAELPFFVKRNNSLKIFAQQASLALQAEKVIREKYEAIQTERLNAAYTLARKVSHEVNSPLGIIKNYLNLLGMKLSDENVAQDEIRIINEEINRISDILNKLSALSLNEGEETTPSRKESVDVNELLTDLSKLIQESLMEKAGVEFRLDLEPQLPRVLGEKDGLKQIFINLIRNAVEAMESGGLLTVKTKHIKDRPMEGMNAGKFQEDGYAEIAIGDSGKGVPQEMRSRLFEPFAGTKSNGHFGLGLSIVYSLVDSMGGSIVCDESTEGAGTTFRIQLPLAVGH
jgi:signal transduction histidine kinase/HD-like signal output (HDOD) protein